MTDNTQVTTTNTAAVVEQSLMAFGAGMSVQNRVDAKTAFHYASIRANEKFNQEGESEAWFNEFLRNMGNCGWGTLRRSYERESASGQSLTLGALAFKVINTVGTALYSGPIGEAMSKLVGDALEKLGVVTEPQRLFKHNVMEKNSATVGLASCIETSDGEVIMIMTAMTANAAQRDLDTVAFEWSSSASEQYAGMAVLTFTSGLYLRDKVEERIREHLLAALDYDI